MAEMHPATLTRQQFWYPCSNKKTLLGKIHILVWVAVLALCIIYRDRQMILKLAEIFPWQVNTEKIQLSLVCDLRQWPCCCLPWLQPPFLSVPRNTSGKMRIETSLCRAEVCLLLLHWADSRKSRMLKWCEAIAFCFYLEKKRLCDLLC